MSESRYTCPTCGHSGVSAPPSCEACGATGLNVDMVVTDDLGIRVELGRLSIRGGPKVKSAPGRQARWRRELNARPGVCHDSGRETWRVNDVDRDANVITEHVAYRATGEVIVDKSESLGEHRDRGSATPPK